MESIATMTSDGDDTTDTTITVIPRGWTICAYVLLVEERHCECCNFAHRAPGHALRVRIVNTKTKATQTISLPDLKRFYNNLPATLRSEFNNPILPREKQIIRVDVPFCQDCFTETPKGQQDLFTPELQLLSPIEVARFQRDREALAELWGRLPTNAEVKKYSATVKPKDKPAKKTKVFNLKDYL